MTNEKPGGEGLSRRSFLQVAGAAPVALALRRGQAGGGTGRIPIALQLYSLRDDCRADFDACLEQVAKVGFEGVEFAGYFTYAGKGAELRKRLDGLGLKAAGTHVGLDALQGDALQGTIEFHQAIGCRFLVVPSSRDFTDPEKSKALADTFNAVAERLAPLGMACGYHNHTAEFETDGGKTYWDLFAERTRKEVILQQDCGWTFAAGFDPAAYVKKYPGRTRTVHFKPAVREGETGRKPILGQDAVAWRAVYEACRSEGGTEWIVLEQELYPDGKTPLDCVKESYAGLKKVVG
jgi:sugar phosphate isomerase/epimerase